MRGIDDRDRGGFRICRSIIDFEFEGILALIIQRPSVEIQRSAGWSEGAMGWAGDNAIGERIMVLVRCDQGDGFCWRIQGHSYVLRLSNRRCVCGLLRIE